ncbi:hypothetical protein Tsp_10059 [Trichinella spiralis]|uniref:hypothetical protein n=1 Tax=Trichinella spiralis TaxID=6334 RepID=UPI0001EFCF33|nr:hypothetical protein Tsp_10059 [Trichinella spiralis]
MSGYMNLLLFTNIDAISICIISIICGRAELKFITMAMKKSTNMYSRNYYEHIRNYGVLQNSSGLRASCFVPVEECGSGDTGFTKRIKTFYHTSSSISENTYHFKHLQIFMRMALT